MQQLREEYGRALAVYLQAPTDEGLALALELGRKVAKQGLGISDLATLHDRAVVSVLLGAAAQHQPDRGEVSSGDTWLRPQPRNAKPVLSEDSFRRTAEFFAVSLGPIWEAQRRLLAENCALLRLNEAREQEARRIGQDLHDESAQLLAAVHLAVEAVAQELESPHRERLRAVRDLLNQAEDQIRSISHQLRPVALDDFGLARAVELLGDNASRRTGMSVVVHACAPRPLPLAVETALYRMVQEALNNCIRHAQASSVTITVEAQRNSIFCRVKDDGVGFDPQRTVAGNGHGGLGLLGIRERIVSLGGAFSIQSAPGRGTELVATVPADGVPSGACTAPCREMLAIEHAQCA